MVRFVRITPLLLLASLAPNSNAEDSASRPAPSQVLSKEYLERWTPGGNTNALDLPYPHVTAPYQYERDPDWVDGRWQKTLKGPFLSHSFILPNHTVGTKLIAVTAGPGRYLLYDLLAGSFVAGVTNGELHTDPARFGLLNRPSLLGDVTFFVPADVAWRRSNRDTIAPTTKHDYQGLYLQGQRVLLVNKIDGIEVLEAALPSDRPGILIREIELAPHDATFWLTIAAEARNLSVGADGKTARWIDRFGKPKRVTINFASSGIELITESDRLLLRWPTSAKASTASVSYGGLGSESPVPRASGGQSTGPPQLTALRKPGRRHWGEPLPTSGTVAPSGSDLPYAVDRIDPPRDNTFHALFFIAGLDFFDNGDAAICTAHGDVWVVRGLDEQLKNVTWQRFATGLYQPLGLEIVDEQVIVLGRDQLTRLHDENGDGEADFYESFNHDLIDEGMPHAYAMRLQCTPDGSFVFLKSGDGPHGSAVLRLSADGEKLELLARGFRHPFGLGAGPQGEITVADSEGNWVPSSKIDLIERGGFYGFLGNEKSAGENSPMRPLCYIPKVADNGCGGQFWNTSERWGSYHPGGMFHFSWGRCTLHAVLTQKLGAVSQAATVQVPGVVLQSGPAEAEFHPHDGQLYVVGLDGWQTGAQTDGSFERIRYTGKPVHLPSSFAAHADGIVIRFDEPIDPASLQADGAIQVAQWNYRWSSTYGSYHYSVTEPDRVGHDVVLVENAILSHDGKRLFLQLAGLQRVDQIQVALVVRAVDGTAIKCDLYGTVNALAPPYGTPEAAPLHELLAKDNLVAWCIVPFDSRKRGPEERATMLEQLGIRKVAYDWRAEQMPTFDAELEAYARHGIELHAFWMPVDTDKPLAERHWPIVLDLLQRHNVSPELWVMLNNSLVDSLPEAERAQRAADILAPVAQAAAERNCRLAFYNHGGWWGEPDHQIQVLEILRSRGIKNAGIVYSFHHGHAHVPGFAKLARRMQPYLLAVNINGMRDGGPQILPVGKDGHEAAMLRELAAAGYQGPIGILHHRDGVDAEVGLRENLLGIEQLLEVR